jgi:hypothetical protein
MTPATPRQNWTPEAVRRLGMTTDLATAAAILGIGRTLAFDLVRTGQFPIRLIRLGRRVLVPVPDILDYLGVPPTSAEPVGDRPSDDRRDARGPRGDPGAQRPRLPAARQGG